MARIFSVAQRKGGVGKSTTTVLLATALAVDYNKKVLVIDSDNQKSIIEYRELERGMYEDQLAPYEIVRKDADELYEYVESVFEDFDVIFIDMPRLTDDKKDSTIVELMTLCDSILIPLVAGQLDALSTVGFTKTIEALGDFRRKNELDFTCYGFINKRNARKENNQVAEFAEEYGIKVFENSLKDVKHFTNVSTFESALQGKDGEKYFMPFMNEFLEKYDMK